MRIIFIDESGYTPNWQNSISIQPYFVLSAVSLPIDKLPQTYDDIRSRFGAINLTGFNSGVLGRGFEIKAKDVASGIGYWHSHDTERNNVRDLMLDAPQELENKSIRNYAKSPRAAWHRLRLRWTRGVKTFKQRSFLSSTFLAH